ncbi:class II aldolase/adducin family protein [Klebsiella aerogenes]|uniref:class II aldolase/adducin family protein n=1 Tax=Klebsiella aerogenes TaxID=548 RepID=UPI00388D7B7F
MAPALFSRGYATGSAGNLSLLLPDGNLLATPTGACLGELQAQRLSVVTLQGNDLRRQTVERGHFHRAVYLHNPACKAIVLAQPLSDRALLPAGSGTVAVSDEAAFCLIQGLTFQKLCLRISPRSP